MRRRRILRKALGYIDYGYPIKTQVQSDIELLKHRIEVVKSQLQNQVIGEVYCNSNLEQTQVNANTWEWKITYNGGDSYWQKFSQKDINDQVNGKIKIKGQWHDKKNVVFYNDISREKRKVERRFEK